MKDLRSLLPRELEALMEDLGEPKYRARQLFTWLNRGATDFDSLKNLPRSLRSMLAEVSTISSLRCLRKQVSQSDGTVKYLSAGQVSGLSGSRLKLSGSQTVQILPVCLRCLPHLLNRHWNGQVLEWKGQAASCVVFGHLPIVIRKLC